MPMIPFFVRYLLRYADTHFKFRESRIFDIQTISLGLVIRLFRQYCLFHIDRGRTFSRTTKPIGGLDSNIFFGNSAVFRGYFICRNHNGSVSEIRNL